MKSICKLFLFAIASLSFTAYSQLTQIRVACIGNSITQGSTETYPHAAQVILGSHYNVKNYGVGGTTMLKKGDLPYWNQTQFYEAQDFNPHIIILMLGTNDSKPQNWTYGSEFYTNYRDFVHVFRQNGKNPQFYVCFPPPAFIDNFGITDSIIHDQIIPLVDSVRRVENLLLINFNQLMDTMSSYFADGIHPSNTGYAIMGGWAADSILNSPGGFIRTFNASPQKYEQGDSVVLYWESSHNSQVTLNGVPVNETDSMIAHPTGTVPYTLVASGPEFSDTSVISLEYLPPGTIKSLTANPRVLERDAGDSSLVQWTTSKGSTAEFENVSVPANSSVYVSPVSTTTLTLVASGDQVDTAQITIPVLDAEFINRAIYQPVKASSSMRGAPPENVVDGDTATYWMSTAVQTGQWIYVDLGKTRSIDRVVLRWGSRYGVTYFLQSVDTLGRIKNIYTTTTGDGDVDDIQGLKAAGRFVRLLCNARNVTDSGYVLKEFEVYTPAHSVGVQEPPLSMPVGFSLSQNYPNPFNPTTTLRFEIRERGWVILKIYNVLGQEITTLVNEQKLPGFYSVIFNARFLSSGEYYYRFVAGNFIDTSKMLFVK
jgi:lysophospholipase L1-like esterase